MVVFQELKRRSYQTEEERAAKLPGIRDFSRQAYLNKREDQKLQELKDALEDEEHLFRVSPSKTQTHSAGKHLHPGPHML